MTRIVPAVPAAAAIAVAAEKAAVALLAFCVDHRPAAVVAVRGAPHSVTALVSRVDDVLVPEQFSLLLVPGMHPVVILGAVILPPP